MNYPEFIDYAEGEIERIRALNESPYTTGRVKRDLLFLSNVAETLGLNEKANNLKLKSQEYEEKYREEDKDLQRRHLNYTSFYCQGGEVFYNTDYLIHNAFYASGRYEKETKKILEPLENVIKLLENTKAILIEKS